MTGRRATEPALRGLFDHAGMFPPAEKPFAEALADAARFSSTLDRPGLVGADLVLPWAQWGALTPQALDAAAFVGMCKVALVSLPLAAAPAALAAAARRDPRIQVVGVEAHFEGRPTPASWPQAPRGLAVFLEPKWTPQQWLDGAEGLCAQLQVHGLGLKFRCAGATAVDAAALAAIVRAAADAGIQLKATQGLHHPVPRAGFPQGFLGLLAAVRLRQARGAAFGDVEACLAETDVSAFSLRDGISWRGHAVTAQELSKLPPFAIGSCSLDEPDEDLMAAFGPATPT